MAQTVDLVVDTGVLLYVGVGLGHVRLGLVVVVIGDEVLHPVVGEELAELVGQLGGQGLVGGDDQRGTLGLLDGPGHGGGLAGAGDPQKRLEPLPLLQAPGQRRDRRRLIAGGDKIGFDL